MAISERLVSAETLLDAQRVLASSCCSADDNVLATLKKVMGNHFTSAGEPAVEGSLVLANRWPSLLAHRTASHSL